LTIRRGKVAWTATAALALGLIAPQLSTTAASASSSGSGSGSGATREFGPGIPGDGAGSGGTTHRSKAVHGGRHTSPTTALVVDGAAPGPAQSFDGINFYQQRYVADHGNQFSVEPPDQGLSVGPSSVLESVNDTISTYSKTGAVLSGPTSLNKFYGYASAINRKTGKVGAFVTDPVSYFDADTQRFYHVVLTLDVDGSGNFTGQNHLDLAVSRTSAPTTAYADWLHYSFDVTKDGNSSDGINLGDYPHIGADANGFYITTNSYSFFGTSFGSAELYAFSKKQLANPANDGTLAPVRILGATAQGKPSFGLAPATSPALQYDRSAGGTEYFLSSQATPEAGNNKGFDQRINTWALVNTASLDTATPRLSLRQDGVTVDRYGIPPLSDQKQAVPNALPLGDKLGEPQGRLDSSDTRMLQTVYAGGKLYGALDTVVNVGGQDKAGVAYYVVRPSTNPGGRLKTALVKQGQFGVAGNNVTYPTFGVTDAGRAILAMTLTGADYFPSSAYVALDAASLSPSPVHLAQAGVGPQDGFSEYAAFAADGVHPRPRWGDYGATAFDGTGLWMANEYIGQTCTDQQYAADPKCGMTRGVLGNWDTRISQIIP